MSTGKIQSTELGLKPTTPKFLQENLTLIFLSPPSSPCHICCKGIKIVQLAGKIVLNNENFYKNFNFHHASHNLHLRKSATLYNWDECYIFRTTYIVVQLYYSLQIDLIFKIGIKHNTVCLYFNMTNMHTDRQAGRQI